MRNRGFALASGVVGAFVGAWILGAASSGHAADPAGAAHAPVAAALTGAVTGDHHDLAIDASHLYWVDTDGTLHAKAR